MRVRRIFAILCFLAIAVWAGTRVVSVRSDNSNLLGLERDLHRAVAEGDLSAVARLLSDDCMVVINGTGVLTGQDLVSRIASSGRTFELNEPRDVAIRLRGDTAIVSGVVHQRYRRDGTNVATQLRFMHTWVRSGHSWVLLASHAANLVEPRS